MMFSKAPAQAKIHEGYISIQGDLRSKRTRDHDGQEKIDLGNQEYRSATAIEKSRASRTNRARDRGNTGAGETRSDW